MRQACGEAHMKAIIATGELATLTNGNTTNMYIWCITTQYSWQSLRGVCSAPCLDGLHDGWLRLHQNFNWQREDQCHNPCQVH